MYIYQIDGSIPIKIWSNKNTIENGAIEQIENTAKLPFAFHHVALMPDGHQGYGAPIGGIVATRNVIIPNFVGVDIGCGMCAVKTSLTEITTHQLKKILGGSKEYKGGIRSAIPVGFSHHSKKQDSDLMPNMENVLNLPTYLSIVEQEYLLALKQIGTLGGGNHFIEIQKGSDGYIWLMVHSGSRNLGYKVAKYYNDLAKQLNGKWHTSVPKEYSLAFLPLDSNEGQAYLREMNYCVEFALANRKLMMTRICEIFSGIFAYTSFGDLAESHFGEINIAHNYATLENHFGQNVMVHRKGATLAREDTIGIIPGSQGTKSYIVKGLGNVDSFSSCSHGAGRKMSRTKAKAELNLEDEINRLDKQGILHSIRHKNDLDEASGAYKDIATVMFNQRDLVEILVELIPLAVVKG